MSAWHPKRTIGLAMPCGVILLAAVAATGCESSSSTSVTNPTAVRCAVGVSPRSASIGPGGGTASVAVTVNRECAWSARAEADWVALSSPASGQGNGRVSFSVAPNASTSSRQTALVINDTRVEISQTGIVCAYSLGSEGRSFDANGGEFTVSVLTQATCGWTATSNAPWLALTSGRSGTGNGTVSVTVAQNTGAAREGTLTIAGRTFTVRQAEPGGSVPPEPPSTPAPCTFVVAPLAPSIPAAGGTTRVTVTASGAKCTWTAASGVSWIEVLSGASGKGNGHVTLSVAPNQGPARSGLVTIAGQAVTVSQLGAAQTPTCSFTVSPTTIPKVSADGGSGRVDVTASDASCAWTASSGASWLKIRPSANSTGDGTVSYTVNPNTGIADRSATLTVAGRALTISQAGAPAPVVCTVSVSPAVASMPAAGGTSSVSVTVSDASCRWSAASNTAWLTITAGSSGTGNGSVSYSVAENTETVERSGTIDVSGQRVTVTQQAASPPVVEVSLRGEISGLAGVCPFATFTVEARLVATNSATVYEKGDCDKLRNGRRVRVTGHEQLNGTVLATRVRFD